MANDIRTLLRFALEKYGILSIRVVGSSMGLAGTDGTVAIKIAKNRIRIGQCVLYQTRKNCLVYHRVIGRKGLDYLIKGDEEDWIDVVPRSRIIALDSVGQINIHANGFIRINGNCLQIQKGRIVSYFKKQEQ